MIKNKEITAVEVLDEFYKRIDNVEEKIGAFNSYTREQAYETAKKVDEKIAKECMISQTTYSNYELGIRLITTLSLYTLCKNHKLSMDEVIGKKKM